MKKIIFILVLSIFQCSLAQSYSDSLNVQLEINRLKNLHAKDSSKIELLLDEIKELISLTENQKKESELRFNQILDSINVQRNAETVNRYQTKANGIPVILFSDTLFYVYNDLPPLSATERAKKYSNAIESLYELKNFKADSIKLIKVGDVIDIMYENKLITAVSDLDVLWVGKPQQKIAFNYKNEITESVLKYREKNSFNQRLLRIGELAILAIVLLSLFYIIRKVTQFLSLKFKNNTQFVPNGIAINNYQFIDRTQLSNFVDRFLWLAKYFLYILTLFIITPLMLRLFPQTEIWVVRLNHWVSIPFNSVKDSIFNYIPKMVKIVLIVFIGKLIIRFLRFISMEIHRKRLVFNGFHAEWALPTFSLFRFILNVFIIIMIFPLLPGADSIAFKGISVFLGVLLSIGSSSAITNVISGLVITYMRPYKVGDWIKTKEKIGVVIEKNLLVTRVKTFNNEDITIPNSSILNDHTINFSSIGKEKGLALSVQVSVRYDYNPGNVEERLIEAALRTNDVTTDIPPYVLHLSLNELNATYELNAYTLHPENMYFIKSDLTRNVKNVFKEANIEMTINNYFEIKSVDDFGR